MLPNDITFVTTSKGRLHHIEQTLPRVVAERPDQVVVVDYACPQGTGAWVEANHPAVQVIRIEGDPGFCLPLARNTGGQAARTAWICFIDADILVQPGFVAWLRDNLQPGGFYRAGRIDGRRDMETYGTFLVAREDFERLGGYDEAFRGWGGEDDDIYRRLAEAGLDEREYPPEFVVPISHEDDERTAFHPVKERTLQKDINFGYQCLKADLARLNGGEPPLEARRALMEQMRDAFTEWAADAEKRPLISRPLKWQRLSRHYPDYQIVKRLTLTVMPVEGARPVRDKAAVTVAIVTVSKGRLAHLMETLPGMLAQGADEVVVVDYSCPDGSGDWVEKHHPDVRVVRVNDDPGFSLARARNLGVAATRTDWVCCLDADVLVYPAWLDWMRSRMTDARAMFRCAWKDGRYARDLRGSFCVSRSAFDQVGGYDAAFRGWGGEDTELYERLQDAGLQERGYPYHFLACIEHGDELRTRFFEERDKSVSRLAGLHYMALKRGLRRLGIELPEAARMQLMTQAAAQAANFAADPGRPPKLAIGFDNGEVIAGTPRGKCRIRHNLQISIEPEEPGSLAAARPVQVCRPRKRTVMFHIGRSGSRVLADLLGQQPDMSWERELYEKMLVAYEQHYGKFDVGDPRCPIDPVLAVQQCLARTDDNLYGLEVKFFHLVHCGIALKDYVSMLKRLGFDGWIVLKRRNLLRVVASALIGSEVGSYHYRSGGPAYPKRVIRLDPNRVYIDRQSRTLVQCLDEYTAHFQRLDALLAGTECLQLTYEEDIEQDPIVGFRRIAAYLGLPPAPDPEVRLHKTNPYPLAEMIENLDEVRACLRGTPYAWMAEA